MLVNFIKTMPVNGYGYKQILVISYLGLDFNDRKPDNNFCSIDAELNSQQKNNCNTSFVPTIDINN